MWSLIVKMLLLRFGEKKFHVQSYSMSSFVKEFNQLKGCEFVVKVADMQDLCEQVSNAQNSFSQLNTNGMTDESMIEKMLIGYGSLGVFSSITAMMMGGELVTAILGFFSTSKMEEKLDDAKAHYSKVEAAVKKADVMIDNLQAVRKVVDLFTRQITKFDALFFSLSQDAIATMKKHHYDISRYNQKEKDQLSVTVSTLMTLSAFLKVPIMDEHQKLNEKAKNALNLMRNQINALESGQKSGHYDVAMIQSNQTSLENL